MKGKKSMKREFIMISTFDNPWKDMGLIDDDLRELQNLLLKNPFAGDIIQGTGGARKLRFALPGTGKSSGIRIIYLDITHLKKLYLVLCYPKGKQDDLSQEQKKYVKKLIEILKGV